MGRLEYVKKEYARTRTVEGKWYLSSCKYKYNITPVKTCFEMLKRRKLVGLKCRGCNHVFFPPKLVCPRCMTMPDKWVGLRETGVVATFTATYDKDEKTGELVPVPIVAVRLDGADTIYTVELNPKIKFDDVYVGMPVKVKWRDGELQGNLSDIEYFDAIEDAGMLIKEPGDAVKK
nr:zinc ribbon domain-containing protein [Candidatus Sigynarchaeum springense]